MPFQPGQSGNPAGRQPGTTNKLTRKVRDTFEDVFTDLQKEDGPAKLDAWARKNPTEFYKLASKLIPLQVQAEVEDVTPLDTTTRAARLAGLVAKLKNRADPPEDGSDLA